MAQEYKQLPSTIYEIHGAPGLCLDRGVFLFGSYVESEMASAEAQATNSTFARSYRLQAFAKCMGDDMETSTAGFADPFATGALIAEEDSLEWDETG